MIMKKMNSKILTFGALALTALTFTACEDVIEVDLDEGTPQLTVDAFITDEPGQQDIRLTITAPYFDNSGAPAATGATVTVMDNTGLQYNFTDPDNDGYYSWNAGPDTSLAHLGNVYTLQIDYDGESYMSTAFANRVPEIDSISVEFREAEFGAPEGYYASLYAIDFAGLNDFYWIRTSRNDTALDDPAQLNLCKDAAFAGDGADGFTFILPIREAITPFNEPYNEGDTIAVELWSINPELFGWLQEAQTQMQNAGLFAEPPANVSTNIINMDSNSEVSAVGMFSVSLVKKAGVRVTS